MQTFTHIAKSYKPLHKSKLDNKCFCSIERRKDSSKLKEEIRYKTPTTTGGNN